MRARILLLAGGVLAAAALSASDASAAACFGAAARDAARPCKNATRTISPTIANRDRPLESPCAYKIERGLRTCSFGAPARGARAQIALLGDSHAWHWRAALDVVARNRRWHAFSVTGPGCPFSDAVHSLPDGIRAPCEDWYRSAKAWFRFHPEVSTVFVSQLNTEAVPLIVPPGQTLFGLRVAGFAAAWSALPATVKHVVVIRDVPSPAADTLKCVSRVVAARRQQAGPACAMARTTALTDDVGGGAVDALHARRYSYIDMSRYFCDAARCFPVVGGALVYRDVIGHLTVAFSRSLGPYLLRRVQLLTVSWH